MKRFILCASLLYLRYIIVMCSASGSFEACDHSTESSSSEEAMQPNIILIYADDLGWNDIGWNNPEVITPALDDLAANGLILNQNYMQSVCTPSRAALMTGKYPFRVGLQHNVLLGSHRYCLPKEEKLLPELLKEVNYKTHLLGKWHLGFCSIDCTPIERGYDTFYGCYNGQITHYTHSSDFVFSGYDWQDGNDADVSVNETYATDLMTERALDIIAEHDCDKPMFMLFSHVLPHTPLEVPPGVVEDPNQTLEGIRNNYLAMVTAMDDSVDQVVQALKDKGLYENSIIIFSSDNGGQFGASSNAPWRGEKASVFEGGTRVPAMVHSPLLTSTGIQSDGMMHVTDWFSTILKLAGSPADISLVDGLDQSDMLMNGGDSNRQEFVYNLDSNPTPTFGAGAIRIGDYKLIVGFPGLYDGWEQDDNICFTHELDLVTNQNPQPCTSDPLDASFNFPFAAISAYTDLIADATMLFNLADDPEERNDLSNDFPDLVDQMKARLDEYRLGEVDLVFSDFTPDPASNPDHFGGIWTAGWCDM